MMGDPQLLLDQILEQHLRQHFIRDKDNPLQQLFATNFLLPHYHSTSNLTPLEILGVLICIPQSPQISDYILPHRTP